MEQYTIQYLSWFQTIFFLRIINHFESTPAPLLGEFRNHVGICLPVAEGSCRIELSVSVYAYILSWRKRLLIKDKLESKMSKQSRFSAMAKRRSASMGNKDDKLPEIIDHLQKVCVFTS